MLANLGQDKTGQSKSANEKSAFSTPVLAEARVIRRPFPYICKAISEPRAIQSLRTPTSRSCFHDGNGCTQCHAGMKKHRISMNPVSSSIVLTTDHHTSPFSTRDFTSMFERLNINAWWILEMPATPPRIRHISKAVAY
jgi:hypothetical protein